MLEHRLVDIMLPEKKLDLEESLLEGLKERKHSVSYSG